MQKGSVKEDLVTVAEVATTYHGIIHNHSYLSTKRGIKLQCTTFSDSKIAKVYWCRTKCEVIIENVLCPASIEQVLTNKAAMSTVFLSCN